MEHLRFSIWLFLPLVSQVPHLLPPQSVQPRFHKLDPAVISSEEAGPGPRPSVFNLVPSQISDCEACAVFVHSVVDACCKDGVCNALTESCDIVSFFSTCAHIHAQGGSEHQCRLAWAHYGDLGGILHHYEQRRGAPALFKEICSVRLRSFYDCRSLHLALDGWEWERSLQYMAAYARLACSGVEAWGFSTMCPGRVANTSTYAAATKRQPSRHLGRISREKREAARRLRTPANSIVEVRFPCGSPPDCVVSMTPCPPQSDVNAALELLSRIPSTDLSTALDWLHNNSPLLAWVVVRSSGLFLTHDDVTGRWFLSLSHHLIGPLDHQRYIEAKLALAKSGAILSERSYRILNLIKKHPVMNLDEAAGTDGCGDRGLYATSLVPATYCDGGPGGPYHSGCFGSVERYYQTFDSFFHRRLKEGARRFLCYHSDADLCAAEHPVVATMESGEEVPTRLAVLAPVDAAVVALENLSAETKVHIKGDVFSLHRLLALDGERFYNYYHGGTAFILRLLTSDYHHFHFPVDGVIRDYKGYAGFDNAFPLPLVGAARANALAGSPGQGENVHPYSRNKRTHLLIQSEEFGCVVTLAVGVFEVATSVHVVHEGQRVVKGMEHGFFTIDGSTVVLLFPPGVQVSSSILAKSSLEIHTAVQVGDVLGRVARPLADSASLGNPCAVPNDRIFP